MCNITTMIQKRSGITECGLTIRQENRRNSITEKAGIPYTFIAINTLLFSCYPMPVNYIAQQHSHEAGIHAKRFAWRSVNVYCTSTTPVLVYTKRRWERNE